MIAYLGLSEGSAGANSARKQTMWAYCEYRDGRHIPASETQSIVYCVAVQGAISFQKSFWSERVCILIHVFISSCPKNVIRSSRFMIERICHIYQMFGATTVPLYTIRRHSVIGFWTQGLKLTFWYKVPTILVIRNGCMRVPAGNAGRHLKVSLTSPLRKAARPGPQRWAVDLCPWRGRVPPALASAPQGGARCKRMQSTSRLNFWKQICSTNGLARPLTLLTVSTLMWPRLQCPRLAWQNAPRDIHSQTSWPSP